MPAKTDSPLRSTIHDRATVADVVRWIEANAPRGAWRNADGSRRNADVAGLSHSTRRALKAEERERMTQETLVQLEKAISQCAASEEESTEVRDRLHRALRTPAIDARIHAHYEWCERWISVVGEPHDSPVWSELWDLTDTLVHDPRYFPVGTEFDRFYAEEVEGIGLGELRAQVAWWNVIAPLVQSGVSGGVEMDWRDMPPKDVIRFVRLGMERERLLLKFDHGDWSAEVWRAEQAEAKATAEATARRRSMKVHRGQRSGRRET